MISVICVYNRREVLEEYLKKSLDSQNVDYQLILVDNTQRRFKSAAKALNHGGGKARGDFLMFVHQDISLSSPDWLAKAEEKLSLLPRLGIAGVAGKRAGGGKVLGRVLHGEPPRPVSEEKTDAFVTVQTVDECLFFIPRVVWEKLQFDDGVLRDWHLYAVDYSLSVQRLGYQAYVLDLPVYHLSVGESFSPRYYSVLERLQKKHRHHHRAIHTTMGDWPTSYPLRKELKRPQQLRKEQSKGGKKLKPLYSWKPLALEMDRELGQLAHGEEISVTLTVENSGRAPWYRWGLYPVRLATCHPRDRSSLLEHPTWFTSNRPAELPLDEVLPGKRVSFNFIIRAPREVSFTRECFTLVADGLVWMDDTEVVLGTDIGEPKSG